MDDARARRRDSRAGATTARDVAFVIGSADGSRRRMQATGATPCSSLSALTLPHALVRVVLAEQLYRAVSLIAGHPYHRE